MLMLGVLSQGDESSALDMVFGLEEKFISDEILLMDYFWIMDLV